MKELANVKLEKQMEMVENLRNAGYTCNIPSDALWDVQ